jgi:predicted TIM-barrel fold metal-dependent hydrolase
MRANKAHKVLFGSNHPFWSPGECIHGLDDLELNDNAKALFLSENAKRVFKIN